MLVAETNFPDLELIARGKVRDVYRADDEHLLLVATDRISAFDCILPNAIPHKGTVLTQTSKFWFDKLEEAAFDGITTFHHLVTIDIDRMPATVRQYSNVLRGRSMLVKETIVFPVECVVRGYIAGSGWKDYQQSRRVCGSYLPENLRESDKLPDPIFTPATKAAAGHDENIDFKRMTDIVGVDTAIVMRDRSLAIYAEASEYARTRGIIIADTKFEFGVDQDGTIILIDEVLTPDSSRFWSAEDYQPGQSQASFDKQFVRDYLETLDWNKQPPAPPLPPDIVEATTNRYLQAYKILTGEDLRV